MSRHRDTCRCDECVIRLADQKLVRGIVYRLGLHGDIGDSAESEHKARLAVSRGILQYEGKL